MSGREDFEEARLQIAIFETLVEERMQDREGQFRSFSAPAKDEECCMIASRQPAKKVRARKKRKEP